MLYGYDPKRDGPGIGIVAVVIGLLFSALAVAGILQSVRAEPVSAHETVSVPEARQGDAATESLDNVSDWDVRSKVFWLQIQWHQYRPNDHPDEKVFTRAARWVAERQDAIRVIRVTQEWDVRVAQNDTITDEDFLVFKVTVFYTKAE